MDHSRIVKLGMVWTSAMVKGACNIWKGSCAVKRRGLGIRDLSAMRSFYEANQAIKPGHPGARGWQEAADII
jgi:hypothetical protein